jgi:hypothetical protein
VRLLASYANHKMVKRKKNFLALINSDPPILPRTMRPAPKEDGLLISLQTLASVASDDIHQPYGDRRYDDQRDQ